MKEDKRREPRKEEREERINREITKSYLVDFVLEPMRLFLGFSELKSLLFNFYHEVYLS